MKTFYSILSAVINPVSGEKIAIGLLLSDGNESIFRCSDSRLSIVNQIVDNNTRQFIKSYIKSIDSVIRNIDINNDTTNIFYCEGKNVIVNEPYIEYLSKYSKNVISFSKPAKIDLKVEKEVFNNLFAKFITEEHEPEVKIERKIKLVKNELFPKAEKHFTIEKHFVQSKETKLLLPVKIDLFGTNGKIVIGHFFDLEKPTNNIKSDFYDFEQIANLHKSSKKFLISFEPEKEKMPQQHYFWSQIRKQKTHTYIDLSEVDMILKYAEKNNVIPG